MDTLLRAINSYTLGNFMSAQIYQAVLRDHPDIPAQMEQGDFTALLGWLREHVHCHGRKFTAGEILERATGSPLRVELYLDYLREKYGLSSKWVPPDCGGGDGHGRTDAEANP